MLAHKNSATKTTLYISSLCLSLLLVIYAGAHQQAKADNHLFSGFYLGVNLGLADADMDVNATSTDLLPQGFVVPLDDTGATGGAQIGYMFQSGNLVFGIEGAINILDIEDENIAPNGGPLPPADNAQIFETRISSIATITGRVGYAMGNWMPYVKAGFAIADVSLYAFEFPFGVASPKGLGRKSEHLDGYVLGGGIDYALPNNLSFGIAYEYIDISGDFSGTSLDNSGDEVFDFDSEIHTVTARLTYHFGRGQ